jgi:DNA adenine methylase
MPKPFLKWAGGKGRLAPQIVALAPVGIGRYIEPFLGAGAVFFALAEAAPGRPALLADANSALIEAFQAVRDAPAQLSRRLARLAEAYLARDAQGRSEMFYTVRAECPTIPLERAARFIFLNKTCYNGLFRVNSSGAFNVPHGRYANPRIHDEQAIVAAAHALRGADLCAGDFEDVCRAAQPGDFVYLDPPYQPLSATAHFTTYTSANFGSADQLRLRDAFEDLTGRGVAAMLSNSDHAAIHELYGARRYRFRTVSMSRAINSKATGRASIPELLIDNFQRVGASASPSPRAGERVGG